MRSYIHGKTPVSPAGTPRRPGRAAQNIQSVLMPFLMGELRQAPGRRPNPSRSARQGP
jgi:hypothetical protein